MRKVVLVRDMPKGCFYCDYSYEKDYDYRYKIEGEKFCEIENINIGGFYEYVSPRKPDWCPLRPLPEKLKFHDGKFNGEVKGWNDCIGYFLRSMKG